MCAQILRQSNELSGVLKSMTASAELTAKFKSSVTMILFSLPSSFSPQSCPIQLWPLCSTTHCRSMLGDSLTLFIIWDPIRPDAPKTLTLK